MKFSNFTSAQENRAFAPGKGRFIPPTRAFGPFRSAFEGLKGAFWLLKGASEWFKGPFWRRKGAHARPKRAMKERTRGAEVRMREVEERTRGAKSPTRISGATLDEALTHLRELITSEMEDENGPTFERYGIAVNPGRRPGSEIRTTRKSH